MPEALFVINETKPRSKSFEVSLELHDKKFEVWTGLRLQPRRLKFPDPDLIKERIDNFFNLESLTA